MARYGKLPEEVLVNPRIGFVAKAAYAALAMSRNSRTGQCNPTHAVLCGSLRLCRRALINSLRILEHEGEIIRHHEPGKPTWYELPRLAVDAAAPAGNGTGTEAPGCTPADASTRTPTGASSCTPVVHLGAPPRASTCTPSYTMTEQTKEQTKEQTRGRAGESGERNDDGQAADDDPDDALPGGRTSWPVGPGVPGQDDPGTGHPVTGDCVAAGSQRLLEYWDAAFPRTRPVAATPRHLSVFRQLLTDHGRTEEQIRALIDFIRQHRELQYYPAPPYLLRTTGGGDGPLGYVRLEIKMAAAKEAAPQRRPDAVDEIIERARRRREDGAQ